MEQPPSQADLERPALVRTPAGEDEPLLLGVWGITRTGPVSLSVKEAPFPVTIRHIEFEPHYVPPPYEGRIIKGGRIVGFATYLPEQGIAYVRKGKRSVFWINVEVPKGTEPGEYKLVFKLIVHQKKVLDLEATVQVLDFELPRADIAYGMYFRPTDGRRFQARYRTPELFQAYWRDMARHGMTSVTIYNYAGRIHDDAGNPKLDGNTDIQMLKDMMAADLVSGDIPVMWLGSIDLEAAEAIRDEFQRRGWPELLLYAWDEPPVSDRARAAFEEMRPIREILRNVTAISGEASEAYADLLDVHVVHAGVISPELQKLLADAGAEVWTYSCSFRARGNAPTQRFYAGLYTWALRLKGNFLWCYTEKYSWEGERYANYCYVLPSDGGVLVPAIAWEARREGVEDYRTLRCLESLIAAEPARAEAKEAAAWLEKTRGRVDWYLARNLPPASYPWDGIELQPMCGDFEPAELAQVRGRAVEYIQQLRGSEKPE